MISWQQLEPHDTFHHSLYPLVIISLTDFTLIVAAGRAEQAHHDYMEERKQERKMLQKIIDDGLPITPDRIAALKAVFSKNIGHSTPEELALHNHQRLEGIAEMALLRLQASKAGPSENEAQ